MGKPVLFLPSCCDIMDADKLYRRYQELQDYVGWTEEDAWRVRSVAAALEPFLPALVDDFYAEIDRHPEARKVITGGPAQVSRLKGTLRRWLGELLVGPYDREYVARRWQVGWRHVEIGLDQVYTNVALSRLRRGLLSALEKMPEGSGPQGLAIHRSLNILLDLDLAIIEDAYQAEHAARLQRSERLAAMRSVLEAISDAVMVVDEQGRVLLANPAVGRLIGPVTVGAGPEQWPQRGCTYRADGQTTYQPEELVLARALAGEEVLDAEELLRRPGWPPGPWVSASASPLRDDQGVVRGAVIVWRDISERKRSEERLLQAERLAAIGQMMTGLAHESGNALARSQSCLEMLAWEVEDRPEALRLIERIQKAQDHLKQLYEEVRSYAAPLKLEREPWDLSGIWRQAWENLALARKDRDAALREETGGLDLVCDVDPFRLEQVFRNILDNALAACTDPVRIVIHGEAAELDGRPAVRVAIRDNGPGLSPEQQQRIFDPFFTTKTKGTGLGMAIAKRIVEAHGGRIAVDSAVGGGAEISITLLRATP
jgi:signal transduction histidine kinase